MPNQKPWGISLNRLGVVAGRIRNAKPADTADLIAELEEIENEILALSWEKDSKEEREVKDAVDEVMRAVEERQDLQLAVPFLGLNLGVFKI